MKIRLYNLSHEFTAPAAEDKPIHLPFGQWPYDGKTVQRFDRAAAERIAAKLASETADGNPGIPVYQGHPDVPDLAAKYPDKGAIGWVKRIDLADDGCNLTVEWDRYPGRGFGWFSPYWFGERVGTDGEGRTVVAVDHIASIGLVNNPNISEFRLPNESAEDNEKGKDMNIEELKKLLGLPSDATEDQVKAVLADLAKAKERAAAAEAKATAAEGTAATANAECETAKKDAAEQKTALENCRRELAEAKTALANEQAAHARTKALKTASVTTGLANQQRPEGSAARMALVNECQRELKCGFDAAWAVAKAKNPELFK